MADPQGGHLALNPGGCVRFGGQDYRRAGRGTTMVGSRDKYVKYPSAGTKEILTLRRTRGFFHGYSEVKHSPSHFAYLEGERGCATAWILLSFLDDSRSMCPDG